MLFRNSTWLSCYAVIWKAQKKINEKIKKFIAYIKAKLAKQFLVHTFCIQKKKEEKSKK